jgi:hypothetical protein
VENQECQAPIDCQVADCAEFARVAILAARSKPTRVCVAHIRETLESNSALIEIRRLDCPLCARSGCRRDAVTQVDHDEAGALPVCQGHLDDLSWMAMPPDLLSDLPGWSHE